MQDDLDIIDKLRLAIDADFSADIKSIMADLHPADAANMLESLPPEQRLKVWNEIPFELLGETLTEVNQGVRVSLIEQMDDSLLAPIINELDVDDLADLMPDLPDTVIREILFTGGAERREDLDKVLSYAEDTAGGLMNLDTITIRANIPLSVVQRYLRLLGELPEYTDKLFIIDRDSKLIGALFISDILTNESSTKVRDLLNEQVIRLNATDPQNEVAQAFERYNLISAPVVDENQRLLGRVTIDDVVDVIREEAVHSMMAQAGLKEDEDIFAPAFTTFRNRAVWLGVNLLTAIIASFVIGQFEAAIAQIVALAVLMPIIASMGGNAGTQSMTFMIRGLATDTISMHNVKHILKKEMVVGFMNGIVWAIAAFLIAIAWYGNYQLGAIVAVSMMINLLFAAFAGVCIPIIFDKLKIDPALASGVMLTTVTDVVGFFTILGLASAVLL